MVPDIWSVTDKIFCHFGSLLAFLPPNNPNKQNFEKMKKTPGDIIILHKCNVNDNFLSFWTIICPFTPLATWKIKILKKMQRRSGYIIFLYICTINGHHTLYDSWDNRVRRAEFFLIMDYFLPFYPLTTQKTKILKKLKKIPGDIIVLYMCTINDNHMIYSSWDIECDGQNFLSFWIIFCPFTPMTTQIN